MPSNISIFSDKKIVATKIGRIEQDEKYNFVEFSEIPQYRKVNEDLLKKALTFIPKNIKHIYHVDNATGTGLAPQIVSRLYEKLFDKATIIGVDPDLYALEKASKLIHTGENVEVFLIQGYGQDLQKLLKNHIPTEGVDVVSIHDAIHEIPGLEVKKAIFASQAKILRKGGIQTYNSSFTTQGMQESAMQWGKWKLAGFMHFGEGRNKSVEAIEINSPEEYRQMIIDSGLTILHEKLNLVTLSLEALRAIAHYPEFVNGVFRDMNNSEKYSLKDKSDALVKALEKENITSLSRNWHEIIAQKPF